MRKRRVLHVHLMPLLNDIPALCGVQFTRAAKTVQIEGLLVCMRFDFFFDDFIIGAVYSDLKSKVKIKQIELILSDDRCSCECKSVQHFKIFGCD